MLTRDEILARKAQGATEHKLKDGSGEVMIRGLSVRQSNEVGLAGRQETADGITLATVLIVHYGLVEPEMSPEDVEVWAEIPGQGGVIEDLASAISDLSSFGEGAQKSRVPAPARKRRN